VEGKLVILPDSDGIRLIYSSQLKDPAATKKEKPKTPKRPVSSSGLMKPMGSRQKPGVAVPQPIGKRGPVLTAAQAKALERNKSGLASGIPIANQPKPDKPSTPHATLKVIVRDRDVCTCVNL
jgi:hypothetical protein